MFDFITIGGATQDIFIESDRGKILDLKDLKSKEALICFEYGEKIEIDKLAFDVGGGAINAAVNFANLGFDVSTIVKLGKDLNAKAVLSRLEEKGVDKELLISSDKYKTGFSVILTSFEGERTVLMHRGANNHLNLDEINWDQIKNSRWVYISSLSGESNSVLDKIAEFAEDNNVKLAFNPGSTQLKRGVEGLKKVLSTVEVLVLNKSEAAVITGIPETYEYIDRDRCNDCGTCVELCPQKIFQIEDGELSMDNNVSRCDKGCSLCYENCPQGAIRNEPWSSILYDVFVNLKSYGPQIVAITDGNKGVQAFDGQFFYSIPPFPAKVLSTLGAGDAFSSTFAAGLQKYNFDIEKALTMASINAASVVQSFGAQPGLKPFDQLEALANQSSDYKPLKKPLREVKQHS